MKKFVGLIAKTYSYLKENNNENKKGEGTKSVLQKENLNFEITKTV